MAPRCTVAVALLLALPVLDAAAGSAPSPFGLDARLDRSLVAALDSAEPLEAAAAAGYRVDQDRLRVMVVSRPSAIGELLTWLRNSGAQRVVSARHLIRADVDPRTLANLAAHPAVVWVRRPLEPEVPEARPAMAGVALSTSELTTEGLAPMNGAAWHAAGYTGQGLRVGVIDTGFGGYTALVGSELPPASRVHFQAFGAATLDPDNVHGTACAEIIHDIVPSAELYLAMMEDLVTFYQAMDWLRDQGVAVVLNSTVWFFVGPGDGTSMMHELIDEQVLGDGIFWAVGAGNYREQHWQGRSVDGDGDRWIEFDGFGTETLMLVSSDGRLRTFNPGDSITVYLIWDDWDAVDQDFDARLFLVSGSQETQVAGSNGTQNGGVGQDPTEVLKFTVQTRGAYGVRVYRTDAETVHDLEVFTPRRDLDRRIASGSLAEPGDSPHLVAVGAVSHSPPHAVYEFSSEGPSNGPGGTLSGGIRKPDISGYAGVTTVSRGYQVFSGTSAACPHVVGAAALVGSARPTWSNLEVRRFLEHRAVDLGAPGCDNQSGCGRLHLGTPLPSEPACVPEGSPSVTTFGPSGGTGAVVVTVGSECPWFAASPDGWIRVVDGSAGSGNGTVSFEVDPNPGCGSRQGVVLAAGLQVAVEQAGRDPTRCPRRASGRVPPVG